MQVAVLGPPASERFKGETRPENGLTFRFLRSLELRPSRFLGKLYSPPSSSRHVAPTLGPPCFLRRDAVECINGSEKGI